MPQDAYTLRHAATELNEALAGGKINKIVQYGKEELAFLIYTGKRTLKLTVNVNASDCGVYFTEEEKEAPLVAPNFCMLLRKYLQGAEIKEVFLVGFERILCFRLLCHADFSSAEQLFYVEVMGKYSNAVLVKDGIILGALKTTSLDENYKRTILAGVPYLLPAPQEKINPSDEAALRALCEGNAGSDLAQFLFTRVAGLAPATARKIAETYTGGDLFSHVTQFIFREPPSPCVLEEDGKAIDFYAYSVSGARPFETLLQAEAYFYRKKREMRLLDGYRRKIETVLRAAVKKQEKQLCELLEKKREAQNAEENRIKGELLTANLYAIPSGAAGCELHNYYDEAGGTIKITLDRRLSPAENAQAYFKRYRKQKRTLEAIAPREKEVRAELDYLESVKSALSFARTEEDYLALLEELASEDLIKVQEKRKKERAIPWRTFEKDGFMIFAGRNNLQNEKLIRASRPHDIWLHAQKYHSAHVVIQTEGKKVPSGVLQYAAEICAAYSSGAGGGKVPVDYTLLSHVKKPPKSKAGFVTYTDYQTILAEPKPLPQNK